MTAAHPSPIDHALQRSLAALTIGVVKASAVRAAYRRHNALQEIERQFQIPIGGEAGTDLATDSQGLDFDTPFVYAPGNRDSDFDVPQVKFGAQVSGNVIVTGYVSAWSKDEARNVVTGATVVVTAHAPEVTEPVTYSGIAHFTFQGYAAVDEDETEA